ncbi:hypothetical protein VFPPC_08569 [Pochonia chlamydosporia 170]|uniref:F-box domain-containing protein n=1 Tax=Pochonia chlamydosporia 170 TaxID=1380566 RepID=A0A179FPX5_METCM|nr:hypothetical protein VFPPC_08569 [Pochonia chlamydosporia 170]OAQ67123.1 hypothetical protein VFPPC_08569 [Pochonia chlamydosporia 170]
MKTILLRLKKLLGPSRLQQSPLSVPRAKCTNVTADKPRAGFDNWVAGHPRDEHAEDPSHESRLESLPPEVHRILLSTLPLNELRALVLSSPTIHERYLLDRRYLLCRSLENTLGSVSVDAYAVFQSSSAEFAKPRTREVIRGSLTLYLDWRNAPQQAKLPKELTEQEAITGEDGGLQSHAPLSCTEQTRLMRALYRFQLSCNLFGRGHFASTLQPPLRFEAVDILSMFLCLFEPWEAEEIGCINMFAKEKYDQVFIDIRRDVHEENPKFDGRRPPTPEGAFDFDNSWVRQGLLQGTISRGLELLHSLLLKHRNHDELVSFMQEEISWSLGNILDDAFGETPQFLRRHRKISPRDKKQFRREPLPFMGENDSLRLLPPLAWTVIWHGTYSNLFGHYVQDAIRRWGYVMWDAVRMARTNAKEVLMRQWKAYWRLGDPRDHFL